MRTLLVVIALVIVGLFLAKPAQAQQCCPPGYSTSIWVCPIGTNTDTNCCLRRGLFNYDVKPKVACQDVPASAYLTDVCNYASDPGKCMDCLENQGGAWTAIGCVPTEPAGLLTLLLTFGMGIAGGIAFLLILLGGFQMMTSVGNPEQLNAGRELISSAITGLILIIFSVFLLKLIGYDILRIPGFGS